MWLGRTDRSYVGLHQNQGQSVVSWDYQNSKERSQSISLLFYNRLHECKTLINTVMEEKCYESLQSFIFTLQKTKVIVLFD